MNGEALLNGEVLPLRTTSRSFDSSSDYNPTPHVIPEGENATALEVVGATARAKLVIIMVGLPGNGKTGVAQRICRYFHFFLDLPSQIFSVGDYRRELFGAKMPADFYDPNNKEFMAMRLMSSYAALSDLVDFINEDDGARVAVFDAANITIERRRLVVKRLKKEGFAGKLLFLEVRCEDQEVSSDFA